MLTDVVSGTAQAINALGGKHGEYLASRLLRRLPHSWVPTAGHREVTRQGLRWRLDLSDNLQQRLCVVGSYEALLLDALADHLRFGDVVLDVGANIGAFALPVARRVRGGTGRVIAVEPARDTAQRLRSHVEINSATDTVQVVEVGLSDQAGRGQLRLSPFGPGDVGSRTLEGDSTAVGDPVELTTGDALRHRLGVERFDVIKIDVEGHEIAVLDGLRETFMTRPPRVVVLEVVAANQERAGLSTSQLVAKMSQLGYDGLAVRHRGLVPLGPTFSGNVIFIRRSDAGGRAAAD